MNHRHVYMRIISHAKQEMKLGLRPKNQLDKKNFPNQYFEFHHILPRSLFSLWIKRESNIVALTAREHFFCHQLLCKIYNCHEMTTALFFMSKKGCYDKLTSFEFEGLRKKFKEANSSIALQRKPKFIFTNGEIEIKAENCPEGFWKGKLGVPNMHLRDKEKAWLRKYNTGSLEKNIEIIFNMRKQDEIEKCRKIECPFCLSSFSKCSAKNHIRSCKQNPNRVPGYAAGRKLSPEHKKAFRRKNVKLTEEHKRKIGESNKGKRKGCKGIPHTKDFKKKLSEMMQGNKNTKGKNWFTNGINNVVCFEQDKPIGYWKGLTLKREMTNEKREHYRQAALKRHQK